MDLARAYLEIGDSAGARDILQEVMGEGNSDQQQAAKKILDQLA